MKVIDIEMLKQIKVKDFEYFCASDIQKAIAEGDHNRRTYKFEQLDHIKILLEENKKAIAKNRAQEKEIQTLGFDEYGVK